MNNRTIAQRLYFALGTLFCLFLAGLALKAWFDQSDSRSRHQVEERRQQVTATTAQMRLDLLQMSDGMRGMLLDPRNEQEKNRKLSADHDLDKQIDLLKSLLAGKPDLMAGIVAVADFDGHTLNPLEDKVMELIATDPKAAIDFYETSYLPQREVENKLLDNFLQKTEHANQQEIAQADNSRILGLLAIGILVLCAIMVGKIQAGAIQKVLHKNISALQEVSEQVSSAASAITLTSQSLAEGSSEQASSIEETGASLEELTSMTKNNAENAGKANHLAKQTRAAADKGAEDIRAMSAAMETIKNSSDDIAKIIRTIDEIAFQTNILALNAAVEAARAGEAGMGFAVVADEVRNLAQRSAQAAKETAAKIEGAITNTARGVELSGKVTLTLNDIVAKAREMDELATEVAGASREQTQGITQINTAVGQMDKVTQGNAAGAEESAAAAHELSSQSRTMREAVTELLQLVGASKTHSQPEVVRYAPSKTASSQGTHKHANRAKANGHAMAATGAPIPLESGFQDF
ncbi:MAG TPA: methyl-accepting chemotaxis protein [Verrucomicrobiae bacterium]|nr:methyl-accepting chemotaxis protein [Verrucomicrobiae bacterium]